MTPTLENFKQKSTEELVVIANSTTEDWQQVAIDRAREILKERNVSVESQEQILKEITDAVEEYWSNEAKRRKNEDYNLFEKIIMVVRWPRELLWGWSLRQDGFELKAKRRLQLIGLGIILTIFLITWANYQWEKDEAKRQEFIDNTDISDWERNYYGVDSSGNILRPKE